MNEHMVSPGRPPPMTMAGLEFHSNCDTCCGSSETLDAVFQCHPVQKLHSDEHLAILFADVMNGANVRVIQCRCGLGFALKTGECLRFRGNFVRQEFEGDDAMQPRILGLVHDTHPTTAQLLDDATVRESLADQFERDSVLGRTS